MLEITNNELATSLINTIISYGSAILPWYIIGVGAALIFEQFVYPKFLHRFFRRIDFTKILGVQIIGMLSPFSIMSFLPVASEFVSNGVSPGILFSFFIAERAYDLQSFFIISSLFGTKFAIYNAVAILISLVIVALFLRKDKVRFVVKHHQPHEFWSRQFKLLRIVLLGIITGAVLRVVVPVEPFQLIAGNYLGGIISGLLMGFTFYFGPIIANYPVAKAFADLGMSPVGVMTFLTVSPIFNFVVLWLLGVTVGFRMAVKATALYLLSSLVLTIVFSIFFFNSLNW